MDEQLVRLLTDTQASGDSIRKNAEWRLKQLHSNVDFPLGLINVARHNDVPINVRQSALLILKTFVQACWSPASDDFTGPLFADDARKVEVRRGLLDLSMNDASERKVRNAACLVVSKVAVVDFPEDWPDLLPTVLRVIGSGEDAQLHGALKVLLELVDDCFNDEQFFAVARDLVKVIHDVAVDENRRPTLRALAVSVLRSCFDTLEMVMEDHKVAVKGFAEEVLISWMPFFMNVLKTSLPAAPSHDDDGPDDPAAELFRGHVALKLQVVKVLMRVRTLFPSILSPHSLELFLATWHELAALQASYQEMYISDDRQGRLEDADGLPYTLDFLVLEELDFMQACLRAPPVRKELERQLQEKSTATPEWIGEIIKIAVSYAQITTEEEGLWDIDLNVFLSEETNVTANYTPRTACGDLIVRLREWLSAPLINGLLAYTRTLYVDKATWKHKEAALYLLIQMLGSFHEADMVINADAANGYVEYTKYAVQETEVFLRARGYLVAGSLVRTSRDALQAVALSFLDATTNAIANDSSEIVKVSCIRALQYYLVSLPSNSIQHKQLEIIQGLASFLNEQDLNDLADSDDLIITIIETLRDAILLDISTCLESAGLDLLFTVASQGASNFQVGLLSTEIFEDIVSKMSDAGAAQYAALSSKVLPSLMGAFDVATLTEENSLANLAADMVSVLVANGTTPLPDGFIVTVMPRLTRMLIESQNEELLKSATSAVKYMLAKDSNQMFSYHDAQGKAGLEVILIIVDRLLKPDVEDNAAAEVGGLAAELVEQAGSAKLGPYLSQLLRAVAERLNSAKQDAFVQSLILVFARLSLISAHEVVDFLAELRIGGDSGLQVVISRWLESTINFAGYDDIRQNVIALTRIYDLNDPRIAQIQVKGDLVVPPSDRIMTRSRARQIPDQYTVISAHLKIIKVLVDELLPPSGNPGLGVSKANMEDDNDDDADDDDEWEDDPNEFVDLASGFSKSQLMAFANDNVDDFSKNRDDETQAYLISFFKQQAQTPGFSETFHALSPAEQERLRSIENV